MLRELIEIHEKDGQRALRLNIGSRFVLLPYRDDREFELLACRALGEHAKKLVAQRRWVISNGYAQMNSARYVALHKAQSLLLTPYQWKADYASTMLMRVLPHLEALLPDASSRYYESWLQLITGIQLFLHRDAIDQKLKDLVHGA